MEPSIDKLSRTDIIKLVAAEALEQMAGEVRRAEEGVALALREFERVVRNNALERNFMLLGHCAVVCRFNTEDIVARIPRAIYAETALPNSVVCILTNSSVLYEQRMSIELRVNVEHDVELHAIALQQALRHLGECEQRDTKVSTVKEKVRRDLVADFLKGADGVELMAAARTLAARVKARMLKGESCQN